MPRVEEVEEFETLLAALPRSGHDAWRAAALRQLRGDRLDGIGYDLAPAIGLPPYATPDGVGGAPAGGKRPLVAIADVRDASAVESLGELEGGAQGLWLRPEALEATASAGVRFDFVTTVVEGLPSGTSGESLGGIPPEQRAAARVWCAAEARRAGDVLGGALETLPLASAVVGGGGGHDDADTLGRVRAGFDALDRSLASAPRDVALADRLVLRYAVGPSYPRTLVEVRALELLYANRCAAAGRPEPLPGLRLWAVVEPPSTAVTPEEYLIDAACRATAAATCGPAALTVKPLAAKPTDRARERRRARNVVNVLQLETDLAGGPDVLRGAAWVERAATAVAREVWQAG